MNEPSFALEEVEKFPPPRLGATMNSPEPSFAQMARIFDLRARGLSAAAIVARLGLPVEQVQIVLNPPPRTTP